MSPCEQPLIQRKGETPEAFEKRRERTERQRQKRRERRRQQWEAYEEWKRSSPSERANGIEQLKQAQLAREAERAAERKLGLEMINAGYRVLAAKYHPDIGGSAEAMTRLSRVRDVLKRVTK